MSYIYDIAAVAIIIILSVIGYKKGILISLLGIVSLVAAGAVSFFFSDMAIGLLGFENYAWSKPAFKVGMFALACVLFGVLSRWISKGVNKIPVLGKTNKILGAFLGFLQSLLILFIISLFSSNPFTIPSLIIVSIKAAKAYLLSTYIFTLSLLFF